MSFTETAIVIGVRLRSKLLVCPCGRTGRARYDNSRRRWRHVDFGRHRMAIEAEIRRVDCRACDRVRTEWMPWARPGARHTRDFEDMAGWLVKRLSKAGVAALLRTTWHTIDALVRRLVGEHLDEDGLDGLYRIGVDEIAYKGRKFLTVVTDHDTGRVVHLAEERTSDTPARSIGSGVSALPPLTPPRTTPARWRGQNLLGFALMHTRTQLDTAGTLRFSSTRGGSVPTNTASYGPPAASPAPCGSTTTRGTCWNWAPTPRSPSSACGCSPPDLATPSSTYPCEAPRRPNQAMPPHDGRCDPRRWLRSQGHRSGSRK
ncbi:helix-turn-helix domain-containing protein [Krasilnikovia sp. M28-CT-15]|uniref:helix-turn-helix domain-containing protein n=1 Tax=Krasilnikovia sp. M28-CT-15 TaxID=3373540 RepID=UPI0038778037